MSTDVTELRDRLITVIAADPGPLNGDAVQCAANGLSEALSPPSLELLVTNLETINEIEDGQQFSDDDITVMATVFSDCGDFAATVDEYVNDSGDRALVDCLTDDLGDQQVEVVVLADLLGSNAAVRGSRLLIAGFDGACATEARAVVDQKVLDQFLTGDQAPILECLPTISDDEVRPYVVVGDVFALVGFVEQRCS